MSLESSTLEKKLNPFNPVLNAMAGSTHANFDEKKVSLFT